MLRRINLVLIILAIGLSEPASAQLGRWEKEGSEDLESLVRSGRFRPFLEANYGLAKPRFEGLESKFNTLGIVEFKLGFSAIDSVRAALHSLDERYAFASYLGEDVRPSGELAEGEIGSELMMVLMNVP